MGEGDKYTVLAPDIFTLQILKYNPKNKLYFERLLKSWFETNTCKDN